MMHHITAFFRMIYAGFILLREGVIHALPADHLTGAAAFFHYLAGFFVKARTKKAKRSERMSRALNRLGPSYIKLGQFLATRSDLVGADVAADLALLQDQVQGFPEITARKTIEKTLGCSVEDGFVEFGSAIGSASIAQVHPAWIMNEAGIKEKVAVKIVRPGLKRAFARDLSVFFLVASFLERYVPSTRRLRPICVVENLEQITRLEMDMRLEAAALSEMAENLSGDGFYVPKVYWEYTGRDVLTMEWIDGIKMSDHQSLLKKGYNLPNLAQTLMQSFLSQALYHGFFHADMHPGNLFVAENGTLVAVDFGIVGRLGKKEIYFLAEILYGFIHRDYYRVARVHFDSGYVPAHHNIAHFAQAIRAIGEPIHGQSVENISMGRLLALLFEVTELFDMQTRPELLLLQKTMVVVEGGCRTLDPHFNMWQTAEPLVAAWMRSNLGVGGVIKDVIETGDVFTGLIRKLPKFIIQFEETVTSLQQTAVSGLRLDDTTIEKLTKAKESRWRNYALWLIAICLVLINCKIFF